MHEGPTRAHRPPTLVRYAKARATVTHGPDTGLIVDFGGAPLRVGSSTDNDIVVSDDTVSRLHCEIELVETGVRVRDCGSTNGVSIGGIQVYDAVIVGEVRIVIGDTALLVQPLHDVIEREQAATDRFFDVIGRSARMRELFADLERIAPVDVTLIIEGETGTGKDLVAESVHRGSLRAAGPFVVFDCGAVAPSLAESELFGHERGAFTGAVGQRPGVFEQASRGTLLLDEVGELPKELQPKLLRVLEKREVKRVGGTRMVPVDVRVISATNRNLRAEVQRGNFRQDLYYRLAAARVVVPPLRDHLDDLPLLVEHFLSLETPPRSVHEVSSEVWEMFQKHRWPGNVRELRNAVQRLAFSSKALALEGMLSEGVTHGAGVPSADGPVIPLQTARREAGDAFERSYLTALLDHTGGNVTRAAAVAEVSRQMIQKLMRKHGL